MYSSTKKPNVSPSQLVRCVKGRLQSLIRDCHPRAFRRNYRIESVGEVNANALDGYVARQTKRHPMAGPHVQRRLDELQFHEPCVDLSRIRYSSSKLWRQRMC